MSQPIVFLFISFLCVNLISSRLLYVIEFNRHGARTSTNYHKGPLSSFFGENMKLTPNGFRQHQLLGQFIREKYITNLHFLDEEYNSNQFEIFSTQTQRTIFSAEGFLSGLYPGTVGKIIYENPNLNVISNDTIPVYSTKPTRITEIEIKVIDLSNDVLFHPLSCKLKGKLLKPLLKKTAENQIFNVTEDDFEESVDEIAEFLNVTLNDKVHITSEKKMTEMQKLFFVNSYHLSREWESMSYKCLALMRRMALNKWYSSRKKDSKYLKLSVSAAFDVILKKFEGSKKKQNFLRNTQHKIFTVYSTHDSTIVSILSNLISFEKINELLSKATDNKDIFDFLVPPFASSMNFELHIDEASNELYVMFFYNGKVVEDDLQVINNDEIIKGRIPFNAFKKLLLTRIDMDYKKIDCKNSKIDKDKNKDDIFL